jgi:hypothetical protein
MATPQEPSREYGVYYVRCPEDPTHFILADPEGVRWEKTPPEIPITITCLGCGPGHHVIVTQPWKIGYVSYDERNESLARSEPHYKAMMCKCEHPRSAHNGPGTLCTSALRGEVIISNKALHFRCKRFDPVEVQVPA